MARGRGLGRGGRKGFRQACSRAAGSRSSSHGFLDSRVNHQDGVEVAQIDRLGDVAVVENKKTESDSLRLGG